MSITCKARLFYCHAMSIKPDYFTAILYPLHVKPDNIYCHDMPIICKVKQYFIAILYPLHVKPDCLLPYAQMWAGGLLYVLYTRAKLNDMCIIVIIDSSSKLVTVELEIGWMVAIPSLCFIHLGRVAGWWGYKVPVSSLKSSWMVGIQILCFIWEG